MTQNACLSRWLGFRSSMSMRREQCRLGLGGPLWILYRTQYFTRVYAQYIGYLNGIPPRASSPLKARSKLKIIEEFRNLRQKRRKRLYNPSNPAPGEREREKENSLFEFLANGSGEAREEGGNYLFNSKWMQEGVM